ncbi:MAG: type II toxin-antitoxin system ParD family antitoxin [Candidatus Methanomethylophilus sp.]|jgi:Arc/MetJ-type ribon-helix-helix transcriptional regulator|nr:type II toxin-antitoxin system ParD family antitoxin [Methanomethylophilus sp.]MCI2074880.1 type II toxin-antitoxin system ParD family antitoxin [Methanomethylophilus sp.]MCI2093568.1 type II toxin-antitoxin system ParD family antitoxin [Methanomethylophilus sp.]
MNTVKSYNPVVSLRIPPSMLEFMDNMIATGRFRNRPDYIIAALRLMEDYERVRLRSGVLDIEKNEEQSKSGCK